MSDKLTRVRLTPTGIAIALPDSPDKFVEIRMTKGSGVTFSVGRAGDEFVELQLSETGVVIRDKASDREYQELKFGKDGVLLGAPGNVA